MDRFLRRLQRSGIWNFYTLSNGGCVYGPEAENNEPWSLFPYYEPASGGE